MLIIHTDTHYRTGNASVTRNRVLVVQMVITVANYEVSRIDYREISGH